MNEVKKITVAEYEDFRFEREEGAEDVTFLIAGEVYGIIPIAALRQILEIVDTQGRG